MPLYKLRIEAADLEAGRKAADVLGALPAPPSLAITLFELELPAFMVEVYYDTPPPLDDVKHLLAGLGASLGPPLLEIVPDANWVAMSQAALPPICAGRYVVHGSHDRARFAMHRLAIEIDAGEAFGSGHNATTALCLEILDDLSRRRHFASVLDLGCGSGVLGIAAARAMPGARVVATDDDPLATAIARSNARVNRLAQRMQMVTATSFQHATLRRLASFDLVLANILPGPLIALAPQMRRAIAHGGIAILSGLLDRHEREVLAAYRAHGFRLLQRKRRDGWAAIAALNTRS